MSESLLIARGEADAKMYLCSLRPGENVLLLRFIIIKFLYQLIGYCASMLGSWYYGSTACATRKQ